jgi:diaminopimelate decarboxylase
MAGNYNRMPKPASLLVTGDRVTVIQRRQTFEDVLMCDILPEEF